MLPVYELYHHLTQDNCLVVGAGRIALGTRYMFGLANAQYIGIKGEQNSAALPRVAGLEDDIDAVSVGEAMRRINKKRQCLTLSCVPIMRLRF